jgi:dihydropyrimidine dehydrogenase (NAD+) subunit PreA
MTDLSVKFCGLEFPNPFILPSAQSVRTGEMIRRALSAGWGGAVTQTLTCDENTIRNVRPRLHAYKKEGVVIGLMNIELITTRPLSHWLTDITSLKTDFPERPIIASIMGESSRPDEWVELTESCERAGSDAIELNVSIPHGLTERGSGAIIGQSVDLVHQVTTWVSAATDLQVIVKLTPNVTDIVEIAMAAREGGAAGVTAVNNLKALAGVDIHRLVPLPSVDGYSSFGGYAGAGLKPVALRCVAEIAEAVNIEIAGTGGVETWQDAVEYLLVGASIIQVYTAVMKHGYQFIDVLKAGLMQYMQDHQFNRVSDLTGYILPSIIPHKDLPRIENLTAAYSNQLCIQCGQCIVACEDAGFQAIDKAMDSFPQINSDLCDACGLCIELCPVDGCMWLETIS